MNDYFSNNVHIHSLIGHSEVTIVEVVSEPSFLAGTAAAHLQDNLTSRRIFASYCTQIYSLCDLLCLDEKCTVNKSTSGILLREEIS